MTTVYKPIFFGFGDKATYVKAYSSEDERAARLWAEEHPLPEGREYKIVVEN